MATVDTAPRGERLFAEGDLGRRALRDHRRQDQADQGGAGRPGEPAAACTGLARCSASCPCSTRVRAPRARSRSPTPGSAAIAHDDLRQLADRPPGRGPAPAAGAGPAAAAGQRRDQPTWSSPTCPAGSPRPCLTWRTGSASRRTEGLQVQPRPHPGGTGPARRRVQGDGEQGAGRLRRPGLDPAVGQVGAADRPRPAPAAGQVAAGRSGRGSGLGAASAAGPAASAGSSPVAR